jgi:hypothetical protein
LKEFEERSLPKAQENIFRFIQNFEDRNQKILDTISSSVQLNTLELRDNALRKTTGDDVTSRLDTINELADNMSTLVQEKLESRFTKIIQARLKFSDMQDRFERIPKAHVETFTWVYGPPELHPESGSWNNFTEWLGAATNSHIYWVTGKQAISSCVKRLKLETGKPGSGKSTLMKFLYDQERTFEALNVWSGTKPLFHTGFFFWNSGTVMQMSREGLLQTVLFELSQQILHAGSDPQVLVRAFADRWEEYNAFSGGRSPLLWPELKRAFEHLIADTSKYFYLTIDGLDEFDGDPLEIIDLIIQASTRPNVKICTASRPWPVFEEAFPDRPSLLLEQLTQKDIRKYVTSKFEANRHFVHLVRHGKKLTTLVEDMIHKASGVFLWVYLAVDSLLHGITNADNMSELQARLEALPTDLEDLFDELLDRFEPTYHRQACQLIRLVEEKGSPTLLLLSYADDENTQSGIFALCKPLTEDELENRIETMARRLRSRCRGFLEVYEQTDTEHEPCLTISLRRRAGFLHRTARDYLRSERIQTQLREATSGFSPSSCWANGFLWCLKTLEPREINKIGSSPSFGVLRWDVWEPLIWCIEYALRLQNEDGKVRMTYLDEVGRAGVEKLKDKWRAGQVDAPKSYGTFFELMIDLNMDDYICIKADLIPAAEAKRLLNYTKQGTDIITSLAEIYSLLNKQMVGSRKSQQNINKALRYRSKSTARRALSSKPRGISAAYI